MAEGQAASRYAIPISMVAHLREIPQLPRSVMELQLDLAFCAYLWMTPTLHHNRV